MPRFLSIAAITGVPLLLTIAGCGSLQGSPPQGDSPSPVEITPSPTPTSTQPVNLPRLEGKATVAMVVKGETITIEVNGTNAPITAGNFVDLVQRGFYDGLVFHRVVRDPEPFVVQAGDPNGKNPNFPLEQLGTGNFTDPTTNQPRFIPLEIKPEGKAKTLYSTTLGDLYNTQVLDKIRRGEAPDAAERNTPILSPLMKHKRGAVAMARSDFPDSASSQFYITLSDLQFLDGKYAVFGYVTQGMEAVDKIQQGDRIESAKLISGAENLKSGK
jgi:peptidyl-prolyl cis-trans isomerase B (cyclophilin B)